MPRLRDSPRPRHSVSLRLKSSRQDRTSRESSFRLTATSIVAVGYGRLTSTPAGRVKGFLAETFVTIIRAISGLRRGYLPATAFSRST